MTIIDRLNLEPVDGWFHFQILYLNTLALRAQLLSRHVPVHINLLIDGISLEGPSAEHWNDPNNELMKPLFDRVRDYMWHKFYSNYTRKTTGGMSEWIWHVANWDIKWRDLA